MLCPLRLPSHTHFKQALGGRAVDQIGRLVDANNSLCNANAGDGARDGRGRW